MVITDSTLISIQKCSGPASQRTVAIHSADMIEHLLCANSCAELQTKLRWVSIHWV